MGFAPDNVTAHQPSIEVRSDLGVDLSLSCAGAPLAKISSMIAAGLHHCRMLRSSLSGRNSQS